MNACFSVTRLIPLLLAVFLIAGCSNTIKVPENPHNPVTIYLLDHGRHASLVLPSGDVFTRYSYGDWDYYALGETHFTTGLAALLWSTTGALGRQCIHNRDGQPDWRAVHVIIEEVHRIEVAEKDSAQLTATLDATFRQRTEQVHFNRYNRTCFVPVDHSYRVDRNSNDRIGQWLETLGCRVDGALLWSHWNIKEKPVPQ